VLNERRNLEWVGILSETVIHRKVVFSLPR
jgi:hypothetical protein